MQILRLNEWNEKINKIWIKKENEKNKKKETHIDVKSGYLVLIVIENGHRCVLWWSKVGFSLRNCFCTLCAIFTPPGVQVFEIARRLWRCKVVIHVRHDIEPAMQTHSNTFNTFIALSWVVLRCPPAKSMDGGSVQLPSTRCTPFSTWCCWSRKAGWAIWI